MEAAEASFRSNGTGAAMRAAQNAVELYVDRLRIVQGVEEHLGMERWSEGSDEWRKAEVMVRWRRYQQAVDRLEGLAVSRAFELAKMNMGGTGKPSLFALRWSLMLHRLQASQTYFTQSTTALKGAQAGSSRV
jgi:hypothetical protein